MCLYNPITRLRYLILYITLSSLLSSSLQIQIQIYIQMHIQYQHQNRHTSIIIWETALLIRQVPQPNCFSSQVGWLVNMVYMKILAKPMQVGNYLLVLLWSMWSTWQSVGVRRYLPRIVVSSVWYRQQLICHPELCCRRLFPGLQMRDYCHQGTTSFTPSAPTGNNA